MNSRRTWVPLYLPCLKETLYACVAILVVFSCIILFSEGVPFTVFAIVGMSWVAVVRACVRQELKEMFPGGRPSFTKRSDGSGALNQPDGPWADPYFASNREQHSWNNYQQP